MAAICDSCGWTGTAMRVRDGSEYNDSPEVSV